MKYSACSSEMTKGYLLQGGWWREGEKPILAKFGFLTGLTAIWVIAWKCVNCQNITLRAEQK
ncbi:hypothetical protein HY345_02065 [Candidatus Microgenomates bacterium]|nr:hypothetical protein [Candidatus Microgenomates bacterium]